MGWLRLDALGYYPQMAQQQQNCGDYFKLRAEFERQRWRDSVSQNWLNAMLEQEIGV